MILISPQTAQNLYWMGRYIQRAESMTRLVFSTFDDMLDKDPLEVHHLYEKLGLDVHCSSPQDFLRKSLFDLEYVSLISIINCARENAILTRASLPNRMFSRINALYLKYQNAKEDPIISLFWLESTLQELDAIWGNLDLTLIEAKETPFIKLGKVIERMDLNIRLFDCIEATLLDIDKLNIIAEQVCPNHKAFTLSSSQKAKALSKINGFYDTLAQTRDN